MSEKFWQVRGGTAPIPEWLEAETVAWCGATSPEEDPWFCTRPSGHPGRHVATGGDLLFAAWPGTHLLTPADRISPGTAQRFDDAVDLPLGVAFLVLAMWNAHRGQWVHSGVETIWAAFLLRRWWHRRGRKRTAKVAARIRDLGHRLVVVPVGGGAR